MNSNEVVQVAFDLTGGVYAINLSQNEIATIQEAKSKGISKLSALRKKELQRIINNLASQCYVANKDRF